MKIHYDKAIKKEEREREREREREWRREIDKTDWLYRLICKIYANISNGMKTIPVTSSMIRA